MESLQRTANRGSISTGYDIEFSLKLEDDNTEGMAKNFSGDGNQKTWTYSTWVKRTEITGSDAFHLFGGSYTNIQFMTNDLLRVELYDGASTVYADLNRVFRDPSAWYHIVVTLDTTQSTAADRVKIYINGVQDTSFNNSTYTTKAQDTNFQIGSATADYQFGYHFAGGSNDRRFCGYVAETHYVNGTALDCTSFGEFDSDSGIWIPKEYTGSHGSKGFYFKFDDSSNLGKDSSSGGVGDFTLTNITAANQATDTPTNNFCVADIIHTGQSTFGMGNITEGATKMDNSGHNSYAQTKGTMGVTKGKWYWELEYETRDSSYGLQTYVGVHTFSGDYHQSANSSYLFGDGTGGKWGFLYQAHNGYYYTWSNASTQVILYGVTTFGATDISNGTNVLGIALNMDDGEISYYKNNVAMTYDSGGANPVDLGHVYDSGEIVFPTFVFYTNTGIANFGGYTARAIASAASDANGYGTFEYAPPSGYYALCTKNLAEFG